MVMEIISILLGALILLATVGFHQGEGLRDTVFSLLDLPSLIIILAFIVPVLVRGGVWKDFKRSVLLLEKSYSCHLSELRRTQDVLLMLQRQVFCAGLLAMLITFVNIMRNLDELEALGPNMAVAVLTVLYATILEMLLLPLQLEVKRRIIDYMDIEEQDMTVSERAADRVTVIGGKTTDAAVGRNDGMETESGEREETRMSKKDGDAKA